MKLPDWYDDLSDEQQKRALRLLKMLDKKEATLKPLRDDIQKLRRIAATNRNRKQAAKRLEGE